MIKWRNDYSCFDRTIDDQHLKIFEMINQMLAIVDLDDGFDHYDEILGLLEEVKNYTVYHFSHEEKLFEQEGYDSFSTKLHVLEHKSFIKKVSEIAIDEIDEDQTMAVRKVLDFLCTWLEQHILDTDRKFGQFLKDKSLAV